MARGGSRHGAGRPAQHDKTGDYRVIDIRRWMRDAFLKPGYTIGWGWWNNAGEKTGSITVVSHSAEAIDIRYRMTINGDQIYDIDTRVRLTQTICHLGGTRTWFVCPSCCSRAALLYIHQRGPLCRRCLGLRYNCQSEDKGGRLWRKIRKIEAQLGPDSRVFWHRPKGMHHATFNRLMDALMSAEEARDAVFSEAVCKLKSQLMAAARMLQRHPDS